MYCSHTGCDQMTYGRGRQTAAHEPHVALWPLECGSSTKYHVWARTYRSTETSWPMRRSWLLALKRNFSCRTVDLEFADHCPRGMFVCLSGVWRLSCELCSVCDQDGGSGVAAHRAAHALGQTPASGTSEPWEGRLLSMPSGSGQPAVCGKLLSRQ
uniref:Uncharacterized protein n=1 Tax=Pipistrellus kuhlii TaxID=59472 RepID=A0A7J7ZJJ6_PIPKU|nr:hypothetical protein mPipKuh1_009666 [Pipistrellus kuhlii]